MRPKASILLVDVPRVLITIPIMTYSAVSTTAFVTLILANTASCFARNEVENDLRETTIDATYRRSHRSFLLQSSPMISTHSRQATRLVSVVHIDGLGDVSDETRQWNAAMCAVNEGRHRSFSFLNFRLLTDRGTRSAPSAACSAIYRAKLLIEMRQSSRQENTNRCAHFHRKVNRSNLHHRRSFQY